MDHLSVLTGIVGLITGSGGVFALYRQLTSSYLRAFSSERKSWQDLYEKNMDQQNKRLEDLTLSIRDLNIVANKALQNQLLYIEKLNAGFELLSEKLKRV